MRSFDQLHADANDFFPGKESMEEGRPRQFEENVKSSVKICVNGGIETGKGGRRLE